MTFLIALLLGYLINGWTGVVVAVFLAVLLLLVGLFIMQPVPPRPTFVSRRMRAFLRK